MDKHNGNPRAHAFVAAVGEIMSIRLIRLGAPPGVGAVLSSLLGGRMLRTRLAAHVAAAGAAPTDMDNLQRACAATEMLHTASLCHDDVIDGALLRRASPTLWQRAGTSGAILLGDLFLCEAVALASESGPVTLAQFLGKMRETCVTETEHEMVLRGNEIDANTCLRLARGKTGPLFAFAAWAAGRDEPALAAALETAGYHIGTAYQLADDLLDRTGREAAAGKTLGTDLARKKFTLAQRTNNGSSLIERHIHDLCSAALGVLKDWPAARDAISGYLHQEIAPVFGLCGVTLAADAKVHT